MLASLAEFRCWASACLKTPRQRDCIVKKHQISALLLPHRHHRTTIASLTRRSAYAYDFSGTMPRDWIRFRRELALPNSAHRQAGEFSPMLSTLHWAEKKPNGVHPLEYEICHIVLISAFFNIARRGTYVDIKRCCIWAVDIDPVSPKPFRSPH